MTEITFPELSRTGRAPLRARIAAAGAYLPDAAVSNAEIASRYGHSVSPETIEKILGIAERRVAPKGVSDSDLLAGAAASCLERAKMSVDDLSKILVSRYLGDRLLPMTAAAVQHKLGCKNTVQAIDITGGAHSFLQALFAGACAVESDGLPVLVVAGGISNRIADRKNPGTAFYYGDGAAAVLIVPSDTPGFRGSYFFSNPDFADDETSFRLQDYASDECRSAQDIEAYYSICRPGDWKKSSDFIKRALSLTVHHLLSIEQRTAEEVALWILPEPNIRLRNALVDHLDIPVEKTVSLVREYGNTQSASLPLQLAYAFSSGTVRSGDTAMLLSIGEGIQGGGVLITL